MPLKHCRAGAGTCTLVGVGGGGGGVKGFGCSVATAKLLNVMICYFSCGGLVSGYLTLKSKGATNRMSTQQNLQGKI